MAYSPQQRRNHVRELQHYLHGLSLYDSGIPFVLEDGIYGRETAMAVRAFQERHNLRPCGETNRETWEALVAAYREQIERQARAVDAFPKERDTLCMGDCGLAVYMIQSMLMRLHEQYETIQAAPITGTYDAATRVCIQEFQRRSGLRQTGTVDRATWNLLSGSALSI